MLVRLEKLVSVALMSDTIEQLLPTAQGNE